MSDQKLRDLERRWKETGNVQDEAAYLLERVRVGDLSRERLELAAYCGHEGAGGALGKAKRPVLTLDWIKGLRTFGRDVCVRAALASLEHCSSPFLPAPPIVERAKKSIETWLGCPCDDHTREVLDGEDIVRAALLDPAGRESEQALYQCGVHAALSMADAYFTSADAVATTGTLPQYVSALLAAAELSDSEQVQRHVERCLTSWSLG